ncbi:MAG: N-acetylmuramoyl-L-alanine amidase, partial [Alphaproteobacteria bacterium]
MTASTTGFRGALALLGVLVLLPGPAAAEAPLVTGVRAGKNAAVTRFVLDLTQAIDFTVFTLPDPYRVVIDLPEVTWRLPPNALPTGPGLIQGFRYGLFQPGRSRVVLDVRGPVAVKNAFLLKPTANFAYRFVLDLEEVSASTFRRQAQVMPPPKVVPPPAPPKAPPPPAGKHVVVIDPGHGGVDPGTIGLSGVDEKHINLVAALELKRQLEATGHYVVAMTRDRDVFVSLYDRVAKGRAAGAELFISLHCDAVDNGRVRGATVYTVSAKA